MVVIFIATTKELQTTHLSNDPPYSQLDADVLARSVLSEVFEPARVYPHGKYFGCCVCNEHTHTHTHTDIKDFLITPQCVLFVILLLLSHL